MDIKRPALFHLPWVPRMPAAVQAIQQSSSSSLPISALVSKFLMLASLAILVGQRLFIVFVWQPALKQAQVDRPEIWSRFYRIALISMAFAIGIGILSQAGQVTGKELTFPWDRRVGKYAGGNTPGVDLVGTPVP